MLFGGISNVKVVKMFEKDKTIVEKYDVCDAKTNLEDKIEYGYLENEVGFGWTNAVFLELLHFLEQ
jgi:alpha,alpha-trehalase